MKTLLLSLALCALSAPAFAVDLDLGEEVDITSGSVTGLSCALKAQKTGNLSVLSACPLQEALKEIVVYDVTEELIFRFTKGPVPRYKLEMAYGGGSIDASGEVKKIDKKTGIVTLAIEDYSITEKPKAGGFKGCL